MSEDATLEIRLVAAQASQERSRVAFFATTLVSLAVLIAVWNAYLSTYRAFALQHQSSLTDPEKAAGTRKLQEELLAEWVRSRYITISLIGISVGVGDAPLIASFALMIACTWFHLSVRRENYNLGRLIIDYSKDNNKLWCIYHAVSSYSIFTRVVRSDSPIFDIHQTEAEEPRDKPTVLDRWIVFLYHLPVVSTSFALLFDVFSVYTYFERSPFRYPARALYLDIRESNFKYEEHLIWVWWIITAIVVVLLWLRCCEIANFASATEKIMRQLLDVLKEADRPKRHAHPRSMVLRETGPPMGTTSPAAASTEVVQPPRWLTLLDLNEGKRDITDIPSKRWGGSSVIICLYEPT
jgi:hypothetical protein